MFSDILFSVDLLIDIQHTIGAEWEFVVHGLALFGDSRLILVLAIGLFWYTTRHRPYQVLAASLLGSALGSLLKIIFNQPRPADPDLLIQTAALSPSFPSGHVVLATCFWGTIAWYGWIPKWAATVIVLVVMFTRLYLGAHFLGDVLFGALVGLAWLFVFHRWIGPLLERFDPIRLATVVAVAMAGSFVVLPITSTFAFGWEIVGGLVGAGVGLILQQGHVRFEPASVSLWWQLAKASIGILGISAIILLDVVIGPEIMVVELTMYFIAALWGLLLAPVIFRTLGLQQKPTVPSGW